MPNIEQLGVVTTRSGVLIVIDTGYLNLWSHDREPIMPEGALDTEAATEHANSFVDLRIAGSDAEQAGRLLDISWHPLYVYDQPPDHSDLRDKLSKIVREHKLDAHFEVMPQRMPHRERVEVALQKGFGAGEVQFHGVWAVAVGDVPSFQSIPVLAERSPSSEGQWKRVLVECRPDARVSKTEKVGVVGVDYARLLIADVDALAGWHHEESLDGMADYVFWGRDAEQVAFAVNAPQLSGNEFGWLNLPEDVAQQKGLDVERYRDQHVLGLAGDYRPHSHHWRVMTPTRKSPTESATVELGGTLLCNFMTTWGDGLFEVRRDLTESGDLVRIRIEMEQQTNEPDVEQLPRTEFLM